ncbi:MAG: hypothetical protein QM796_17445 [Chthoniobacteraceae bacterium]
MLPFVKNLPVLIPLAVVLALPFALKPKHDELLTPADETLVIVSPHNEAIRHEFAAAFAKYEKVKTGKTVRVDWRTPGGTTEISATSPPNIWARFPITGRTICIRRGIPTSPGPSTIPS